MNSDRFYSDIDIATEFDDDVAGTMDQINEYRDGGFDHDLNIGQQIEADDAEDALDAHFISGND